MLNLGPGEIIFILVAALLVLGPQRLPELARGIGKFLAEFRRQTSEVRTVMEREFYQMDQEFQREAQPKLPPEVLEAHAHLPEETSADPEHPGVELPPDETVHAPPELAPEPPVQDALPAGTRVTELDPLSPREPVVGAVARETLKNS